MRSTRSLVVSLAAATLAGACGTNDSALTPTDNQNPIPKITDGTPGIYVLTTVAGDPVPAVVISNEAVTAAILADTMFLHADATGAVVAVERVKEKDGTPEYTLRTESPLTYIVADGRLTAENPCNDVIVFAACVRPPHFTGNVTATALDLDYALSFRVPLHYTKVSGPTDVAAVTIAPFTNLNVNVGATLQLSARATNAAGVALAKKISWRSLLSSAATVSTSGAVRGVAEGVTIITAFVDGRADTVTVHVQR
jgi:hypothetical protein